MVQLNHIGIAVDHVLELKQLFSILGMEVTRTEPVPSQGVIAHFLPLAQLNMSQGGSHLEFLEVTDPAGTVAKFIEKRGPGIHHLAFSVKKGELDPLCAKLRAGGYRLIYDMPARGAHAMRINFIHPGAAGGVLIELMEPAGES